MPDHDKRNKVRGVNLLDVRKIGDARRAALKQVAEEVADEPERFVITPIPATPGAMIPPLVLEHNIMPFGMEEVVVYEDPIPKTESRSEIKGYVNDEGKDDVGGAEAVEPVADGEEAGAESQEEVSEAVVEGNGEEESAVFPVAVAERAGTSEQPGRGSAPVDEDEPSPETDEEDESDADE